MKNIPILILLLTFCCCVGKKESTEKYHKQRNNIVNVEDKIIDINTDSAIVLGRCFVDIIDDYLLICDRQTHEKGIHLFNKNTFKYVTSTGARGLGPNEIGRYGYTVTDDDKRFFYIMDNAKLEIFKFILDSVLTNINYKPERALKLNDKLFPYDYSFINDSIIIGNAIDVVNPNTFESTVVKCNINNGEIKKIGYKHPKISETKLTTFFSSSLEKGIYVEAYSKNDLMIICNLEGELEYCIYGPQWDAKETNNNYFSVVEISGNRILAVFNGGQSVTYDKNQRLVSIFPTKFLIFDIEGNYQKTLETQHDIFDFCIDNDNNRLIVYFEDRANGLAFIDLNNI